MIKRTLAALVIAAALYVPAALAPVVAVNWNSGPPPLGVNWNSAPTPAPVAVNWSEKVRRGA